MDNTKNDAFYMQKIISDLTFIIENTKDISKDDLEQNAVLLDSMMFRIIQISENSDKLTNEFKQQNKIIPWRSIKGMRNIIVHDYGIIDLSIIFDTIKRSIPEYKELLTTLVK